MPHSYLDLQWDLCLEQCSELAHERQLIRRHCLIFRLIPVRGNCGHSNWSEHVAVKPLSKDETFKMSYNERRMQSERHDFVETSRLKELFAELKRRSVVPGSNISDINPELSAEDLRLVFWSRIEELLGVLLEQKPLLECQHEFDYNVAYVTLPVKCRCKKCNEILVPK